MPDTEQAVRSASRSGLHCLLMRVNGRKQPGQHLAHRKNSPVTAPPSATVFSSSRSKTAVWTTLTLQHLGYESCGLRSIIATRHFKGLPNTIGQPHIESGHVNS
jgi:hypothetical protein